MVRGPFSGFVIRQGINGFDAERGIDQVGKIGRIGVNANKYRGYN